MLIKISFSKCCLPVFRNTIDFKKLILNLMAFQNSRIYASNSCRAFGV